MNETYSKRQIYHHHTTAAQAAETQNMIEQKQRSSNSSSSCTSSPPRAPATIQPKRGLLGACGDGVSGGARRPFIAWEWKCLEGSGPIRKPKWGIEKGGEGNDDAVEGELAFRRRREGRGSREPGEERFGFGEYLIAGSDEG